MYPRLLCGYVFLAVLGLVLAGNVPQTKLKTKDLEKVMKSVVTHTLLKVAKTANLLKRNLGNAQTILKNKNVMNVIKPMAKFLKYVNPNLMKNVNGGSLLSKRGILNLKGTVGAFTKVTQVQKSAM
ncbi:hypothetical protein GDO86_002674 [Hymenochirus boettgeri]|uniref:Uncharacterized protein n=1 Tax=Hymenochirus boettgeri TaxID=247094 RepID=A0A8T2K6F5_9PIPI|nr:hypothetical protein GDO86_002674 [Hymenochirus boettgeri]